jgi:membrane protein DedA with SNARE-associated domain
MIRFLIAHGHVVLFFAVLLDRLGAPIPAIPILLAAGALSDQGQLSPLLCLALAVTASLIGHYVWYAAGRRGGARILRLLCKIAIEPDACVRQTEDLFERHGQRSLVIAHFVPGLSMVAQPLAGMSRMPLPRYLALDGLGAFLFALSVGGTGWLFSRQVEAIAELLARLGGWAVLILGGGLAAYVAYKLLERRGQLRRLDIPRIRPEELKELIDRGSTVVIVDLRHALRLRAPGRKRLPGAVALPIEAEQFEARLRELPFDREIVLYCS